MGRNSGGGYTNPVPPFVPGTTIKTQEMNQKFSDVYDALSDSLSRSGQGFMQVPLQLTDGSAASPSLTFASDSGTGLYRPSPYTVRLVSQAATLQEWALTYVNINRPLTIANPTPNAVGLTVTGNGTGSGAVVVGGVPSGNTPGSRGVVTTGGAGAGSGSGGTGLFATGGAAGGAGSSVQGLGMESTGGIVGVTAPLDAAGTVMPTRYYSAVSNLPTLGGVSYPVSGFRGNAAGFNNMGLDGFFRTTATITTGWQQVRPGFRYDVDGVVAAGGSLEFGSTGVSVAAGTAATAGTPSNAITATNAYIGFADTVASPATTTAIKNVITPMSLPKATGLIEFTAPTTAAVAVGSGLNISSVSVSGGVITINFAQAFKTAKYSIGGVFTGGAIGGYGYPARRASTPATASQITLVVIIVTQDGGGIISTGPRGSFAAGDTLDIQVYGEQ